MSGRLILSPSTLVWCSSVSHHSHHTLLHRHHNHHRFSSKSLGATSTFSTNPPRNSLSLLFLTNNPTLITPLQAYNNNNNNTQSQTVQLQASLWLSEAVYISWLFLLPFAPGDPVWAISSETVESLLRLSLNFFLVLPLVNFAGIHVVQAPVVHPMSEALFNFVIAWTFMFAPLLFTDRRRDRYTSSLDLLWSLQMFLTNTFLIPYMAIRMNEPGPKRAPQRSRLQSLMTANSKIVGLVGATVCLVSLLWGLFGRPDPSFGGISQRWDFLVGYVGSERLAYAFIWDICFYAIFQPWLIGDNLQNVDPAKTDLVASLRFVPVIGLFAYLVCLNRDDQL